MPQEIDSDITDVLENLEEVVHTFWGEGVVQVSFFVEPTVVRSRVQLYDKETGRTAYSIECMTDRAAMRASAVKELPMALELLCRKIEASAKAGEW